jgi:hypothetical protein
MGELGAGERAQAMVKKVLVVGYHYFESAARLS